MKVKVGRRKAKDDRLKRITRVWRCTIAAMWTLVVHIIQNDRAPAAGIPVII